MRPLPSPLQACGSDMQASPRLPRPWQHPVATAGMPLNSCPPQPPVKQAEFKVRPARLGSSDTPFIASLFAQVGAAYHCTLARGFARLLCGAHPGCLGMHACRPGGRWQHALKASFSRPWLAGI